MVLNQINESIGTARDNRKEPIHNWYRFTAGFSYKLVDKIIEEEGLSESDTIYECFAGCGTTLVSAQKNKIQAVGNEGQELLFDVINAKLNWSLNLNKVENTIKSIYQKALHQKNESTYHILLESLYSDENLSQLYIIRDFILNEIPNKKIALFLKLALTQTLHKVSIHPIAIPYISRSKILSHNFSALDVFVNIARGMVNDLRGVEDKKRTSKIFSHDSRIINKKIADNSCTICITSPPYLNNLDYGEVSKVCSHFYGITDNWNDITEKVRKKLVTGSTTHYKAHKFNLDSWKRGDFYLNNKSIVDELLPDIEAIRIESTKRKGKKSFHILALYYFEDMYKVLLEMRRVLVSGSRAYLVLGDSAPYGVFIDTTKVLGEIALNIGFETYKIVKIRERGTKWTSLRYRHNLKLSENILILE